MAICRFSDFGCDLYIYESDAGIVCHVAGLRYVGEPPPAMPWTRLDDEEVMDAYFIARRQYLAMLDDAPRAPIGLPHDGEYRTFGTWGELREYVTGLKALGYQVPDWVFREIEAEMEGAG